MLPTNKLVLGTVQFGLSYGINNFTGKVSKADVSEILAEAKNSGMSILDTSYAHGGAIL